MPLKEFADEIPPSITAVYCRLYGLPEPEAAAFDLCGELGISRHCLDRHGKSELSKGIYVCSLNQNTGKLTTRAGCRGRRTWISGNASEENSPHAVCSIEGRPSAAAWAIKTDENGRPTLQFLNSVEVGDGGGTHICVDPTGRSVLTAQYGGGSVAVYALNDDGSLRTDTANRPSGSITSCSRASRTRRMHTGQVAHRTIVLHSFRTLDSTRSSSMHLMRNGHI